MSTLSARQLNYPQIKFKRDPVSRGYYGEAHQEQLHTPPAGIESEPLRSSSRARASRCLLLDAAHTVVFDSKRRRNRSVSCRERKENCKTEEIRNMSGSYECRLTCNRVMNL